jgi:hypothetical protein
MKKTTLAVAAVALTAAIMPSLAALAAAQDQTQPVIGNRIVAKPVASGRVTLPVLSQEVQSSDMSLDIVLNHAQNRVGGRVSACGAVITGAPRRMRSCQDILFVFPDLYYDASRNAVILGEQIVARDRGFWRGGWKLDGGFTPEFRLIKRSEDDGFEQTTGQFLELALVRRTKT